MILSIRRRVSCTKMDGVHVHEGRGPSRQLCVIPAHGPENKTTWMADGRSSQTPQHSTDFEISICGRSSLPWTKTHILPHVARPITRIHTHLSAAMRNYHDGKRQCSGVA